MLSQTQSKIYIKRIQTHEHFQQITSHLILIQLQEMSVLIQTSFGDITIDLFTHKAPNACLNFIKLCKIKHYNNSLFWEVQKDYVTKIRSSKPTTIWSQTGLNVNFFKDQVDVQAKINEIGLVATANLASNQNNSEFFITLTKSYLPSLSGKHTVFGRVEQGLGVLKRLNDTYVDERYRPQMNIRILHTFVIDDPYPELQRMRIPDRSPSPIRQSDRLEAIEHIEMLEKCKTQAQIIQQTKKQKAKKQAMTLQMLGDLPDANMKPPENVLFVCKLNPITQQKDLQVIFSRFGPIKSVQITRDWKTGQSLQYGFVEFQNINSCQQAYLKMNNVLIDDRRIQVDFSQSVSKLFNRSKTGIMAAKQKFSNEPQRRRQLVPKSYTQGKDNTRKYDLVLSNNVTQQNKQERQSDSLERYAKQIDYQYEMQRKQRKKDKKRKDSYDRQQRPVQKSKKKRHYNSSQSRSVQKKKKQKKHRQNSKSRSRR